MTRWTLLLLLPLSSPAFADGITAETALNRYHDQFKPVSELACPRDSEDIVVCGRNIGSGLRIPYAREEGEPVRLLPGEPPSAAASLGADRMCMRYCEPPNGSILNVIKGIGALLGKDD
jgi:hypothetical protein